MVLASKTLKLLKPGCLVILCRPSAISIRQTSPAYQVDRIRLFLTSIQPRFYPSPSHQQAGLKARQLRTGPVRCQPSGEKEEEKALISMTPDKPPVSPVDVAHTHALLEFINAGWTPYHAVGERKGPDALSMAV